MENIDHEYREEIICPYCGYKYDNSHELFHENSEIAEVQCENCDETFFAEQIIDVTYSTYKNV